MFLFATFANPGETRTDNAANSAKRWGKKKKKESSFERKRAVVESREEFFPIDGKTGRGHLPGKQWNL